MMWVAGVLAVVLLCIVTALAILWSGAAARVGPAHEPDQFVWRGDGPDTGSAAEGRTAPRDSGGPGGGARQQSPERRSPDTSDGPGHDRQDASARRLGTDVARLGRAAHRALNRVSGIMPMTRRQPGERDEPSEPPARATSPEGPAPRREAGDVRGDRPVPGTRRPLPEPQRQLPAPPAPGSPASTPGPAPTQCHSARPQPAHRQPPQHQRPARYQPAHHQPARPHESQPRPASAVPSGATEPTPAASPRPAHDDTPTRQLRADRASHDGAHPGTAPGGTGDDRPLAPGPGPGHRITTAVTWLRPEGYVEWEGALRRARWHGAASAFPRPGTRVLVRVDPSPGPLVLEAHPLD